MLILLKLKMAGEGLFFFFIIVGLILLIYYISEKEEKRKIQIINFLKLKKYSVLRTSKSIRADNNNTGYLVNISDKSRSQGNSSHPYYEVSITAPVEDVFSFKVSQRGIFAHLFGTNKGDFPQYSDFKIETTNPHHTQLLFSKTGIFGSIKGLIGSQSALNVEAVPLGNKRVQISFESKDRSLDQVKRIIRTGEGMIRAMNSQSYQDYKFGESEKYACFNCSTVISYDGDYCHECSTIAPKCVICYDDPEPGEEIIVLECCKSYAHKAHVETWLDKSKKCPYCSVSNPKLLRVEETKRIAV